MADPFTDFKGIQVTMAAMARALIDGRIDCKTKGQMVVHLQTCSKLLRMEHQKNIFTTETREDQNLLQMSVGERRLNSRAKERPKTLTVIYADNTDLKIPSAEENWLICAAGRTLMLTPACGGTYDLRFEVATFADRCRGHGPPS
jgi:hypothetical protein